MKLGLKLTLAIGGVVVIAKARNGIVLDSELAGKCL